MTGQSWRPAGLLLLFLVGCPKPEDSGVKESDCAGGTVLWYTDADGDGYGGQVGTVHCTAPEGYVDNRDDCDDSDARRNPAINWYQDLDGDGAGNPDVWVPSCDQGASTPDAGDCNDGDSAIHPEADERCDGVDNNCDGSLDDEDPNVADAGLWYHDADGDGFGQTDDVLQRCTAPTDYVSWGGDCNDQDAAFHPSAPEPTCADTELDYNCDGFVGSGDQDGDGYRACEDCNDGDATRNAGASEACNGADDDCDGEVDEAGGAPAYPDADGDGAGSSAQVDFPCIRPSGWLSSGDDCDDTDVAVFPGATEYCDGRDEDCDGTVDNNAVDPATWWRDSDGDGYGDATSTTTACSQPSGYADVDSDCSDNNARAYPGAPESCSDAVDLNCDGSTGYTDADGDGVAACEDCDDNDPALNNGSIEVCDGIDNDCDGLVDGVRAADALTWYADVDQDGYGDGGQTVRSCEQPTGYVAVEGDCDDGDLAISPDATEICDANLAADEDCDGLVDGDDPDAIGRVVAYPDSDGDGWGGGTGLVSCVLPAGYTDVGGDCEDADAAISPAATERCNGTDDNCDGTTDEATAADASVWYLDADGDGFGDPGAAEPACSAPTGAVADGSDCDDTDAGVHPSAAERCDGLDNNCDGSTDPASAVDATLWYADDDGDGFGDFSRSTAACSAPVGTVADASDCNDQAAAISPAAAEVCDGGDVDEDCNGVADDADVGATGQQSWYEDLDGDSWGNAAVATTACDAPSAALTPGDCDDATAAVHPGATEICDAANTDEDCDGLADDADANISSRPGWYRDADGDGYGAGLAADWCDPPTGYTSSSGDCNDAQAAISPAAIEICDVANTDEDCDGVADDNDPSATGQSSWYSDRDADTYGSDSSLRTACDAGASEVARGGDCNDGDSGISPAATERCDGSSTDEDCDGLTEDADPSVTSTSTWYRDGDSDGYGLSSSTLARCARPVGYVSNSTDCNDSNANISPAAVEICDTANTDEDCDNQADDADSSATGKSSWYRDSDTDGYGLSSNSLSRCDQPSGYVANSTDCNDVASGTNPGATEICDASDSDEDCDGLADDNDSSATGQTSWYADADGDGYGTGAALLRCNGLAGYGAASNDCDDANSAISPGATDICQDNVDNDCDGGPDPTCALSGSWDAGEGMALYTGVNNNAAAGSSLWAGELDINGDGYNDLLLGAPDDSSSYATAGAAYLLYGPLDVGGGTLSAADVVLRGESSADDFGRYFAVLGDVDADGNEELAIGAPVADGVALQAGAVYLLEDPAPGTPTLSSIAVRLKGESGGDAMGPVAMLGDSNGDGTSELAVAAPTYSTADAGRVFVMNLPITADTNVSAATAYAYFTHSVSTDQIGTTLAAGDVTGDGLPDLIIGAPLFNGTVSDVGAVFVCEGGFSSGSHSVNSGSTCTRLLGTTAELAGAALAIADTDDDGTDDLIIGAYRNASGVGAVYFVDGPTANANLSTTSPVQVKFTGETLGDYFGWSVAGAGDVDQDGRVDVLVGARTYNSSSAIADNGAVYLIDGATRSGTVAVSSLIGSSGARFVGDSALDYLGGAVGGPGDVTDDGVPDILLGAAGYDTTTLGVGSISLFSGSGL